MEVGAALYLADGNDVRVVFKLQLGYVQLPAELHHALALYRAAHAPGDEPEGSGGMFIGGW